MQIADGIILQMLDHYLLVLLEDQIQIINEIRRLNYSSTRLSVCSAYGGMGYKFLFDSYMNIVDKHQKGQGKGMRWIINTDRENLNLVKAFLKAGIRVRHVRNMPPSIDYLSKIFYECRSGTLPSESFLVISNDSIADPSRVPNGKHLMKFLISSVPYRIKSLNKNKNSIGRHDQILEEVKCNYDWNEVKHQYSDNIIDIVSQKYIPNLRSILNAF